MSASGTTSSAEKLAKLKPVFGKGDGATMTAGNSTPLTDGAAAVLLGTEEWASEHGLEAQAFIVDSEVAAVDFVHGKDGLLMAPTYAVPRLLERQGLTLQDFDFYEIHEAFASTVLSTASCTESSFRTSPTTARAFPPASSIWAAAVCTVPSSRGSGVSVLASRATL